MLLLFICKVLIGLFFARNILAYVYIPVIQKELDIFRTTVWNSHRGRKQQNKKLPCGVPDHIIIQTSTEVNVVAIPCMKSI